MNKNISLRIYLASLLVMLACMTPLDSHLIAKGGFTGTLGDIILSGQSIAFIGVLFGLYQLRKGS